MKKRKKRHGCGRLIAWALLVLIGVLAVLGFRDIRGMGMADKEYVITVPEGAGSSKIALILKNRGIIRYESLFRLYTRVGDTPIYQKGRHTVNPSMSYRDLVERLTSAPNADENGEVRVTVPEGYELRQIVDLLVQKGLGERDIWMDEIENGNFDYDFVRAIPERENRLEGYLYPDTYLFSAEETEHQIIDRMLKNFAERVLPVYQSAASDEPLDRVITMASVVEREAANDEERPQVASVFYNRLRKGMKLESCATVQYILKERKDVLSNADTEIDSPYNTYRNQGLPKGPIASPGLASVKAALSPADTEYLYFVAKADGSGNLFSKTFEEHNQKIREIRGN